MTKTVNEFTFVISAVDQASAALQGVKQQLDSVSAPVDRLNKKYAHLTDTIHPLGKSLDDLAGKFDDIARFTATRLALPTAAFGGYALKLAADFEQATNRVKVLAGYAEDFTDQAKGDMKSLEELARTLGKELKFGPTDVMLGLGELLSNDPDVKKAKSAIKPVLNLSLASDMNPAGAAKLVNAMGSSFENLSPTQSANLLARLQAISSVRLPDFGDTISNVAGQAMLRGEDPTALLAASAVLSRSLIDKSKAGSHLEIFYKKLSNTLVEPDKQDALAKMGFTTKDSLFKTVDGVDRLRSLNELLPKFVKVMNNPNLSKVFGEDAISTILVLLKNHNLFLDFQKDLRQQMTKNDANGSAALQASVSSQGLKGSFEQLKGSIEELSIAIGKSGLLGEVTDMVIGITKIVDSLGKLDARVLSALTNLAAMTLALSGGLAVVSPFLRFAGALGLGPGLLGIGAAGAGGATGAGAGAVGATAAGGAVAGGALTAGAIATGIGAAGAMGGLAYLMTKDMGKGNPFIGGAGEQMSPSQFRDKILAGAAKQRAEIYKKLITGQDLTSSEFENAQYYASSVDGAKIEGPAFTRDAFSYGMLLRKARLGGKMSQEEQQNLFDMKLNKMAGIDASELVKPMDTKGQIVVDFKNVPTGTEIKKEGLNPAFDLKIEFAKGKVMPKSGATK